MNELDLINHIEENNSIAAEYLKGKSEAEISRALGISRMRVVSGLAEWKQGASNSDVVRSRAREALAGADLHYNKLIKQAYDVAEAADDDFQSDDISANQRLTHKTNAIKLVADLEAKRIDMLQRAGLLENQELADQLVEAEERHEAITKIITEVVGGCPRCKPLVLQRMSGIGREPVIIVEGDVG